MPKQFVPLNDVEQVFSLQVVWVAAQTCGCLLARLLAVAMHVTCSLGSRGSDLCTKSLDETQ